MAVPTTSPTSEAIAKLEKSSNRVMKLARRIALGYFAFVGSTFRAQVPEEGGDDDGSSNSVGVSIGHRRAWAPGSAVTSNVSAGFA